MEACKKMKLYIFSQSEDIFEMYTDFTILAKSEDDAWQMILNKAKKSEFDEFITDRSKYDVEVVPFDKPYIRCHYSCG